jgi:hypothetical protein
VRDAGAAAKHKIALRLFASPVKLGCIVGAARGRIVGILIGAAVLFILDYGLSVPWYVYLPSGVISYLLVQYIGWAVRERRRFNREVAEMIERARKKKKEKRP